MNRKQPDLQVLFAQAMALHQAGKFDEAAGLYRKGIRLNGTVLEFHYNLGNTLMTMGRFTDAAAAYQDAVRLRPDFVEGLGNWGLALAQCGDWTSALDCYQRALKLRPGAAQLHHNRALACVQLGRWRDAAAAFERVTVLTPTDAGAHNNLGNALAEMGRSDLAIAAYGRALDLDPTHAESRNNLAVAQLASGAFTDGWDNFEWRWHLQTPWGDQPRNFTQPLWQGEPGTGGTVLLWAEQGFGDTIQFVRYAPLVAARGWQVVVEAPPPLVRLLGSMPGITVISKGETPPHFDAHCPLLSLPRAFGTTIETIPANTPYLHADPGLIGAWAGGPKIGIALRGNPNHKRDRQRSLSADDATTLMDGIPAINLHPDSFADFAETAACIAHLDLVISVDTAVCHLAGALGKPVWTLLDFTGDWRWLKGRDDTPWYPSMRLFRQHAPGEWGPVIQHVRAKLAG